jgi:hypothetical protein
MKFRVVILAIAIMASLTMVGCGSKEAETLNEPDTQGGTGQQTGEVGVSKTGNTAGDVVQDSDGKRPH